MTFKKLAETRYSCRKFLKQGVEEEKIQSLLDVIHTAPSAENHQRIRVWVIQSEERLADVKKFSEERKMRNCGFLGKILKS